MTIDEIEGMSDAEYFALPRETQVEISKVILESLVGDGLAYRGEDGRYRMRENVTYLGDGTAIVAPPN